MRKISAMILGLGLLGCAVNSGALAAEGKAYEEGRRALDRAEWSVARDAFATAIKAGDNAEAAMYWKAYAESKMKKFSAAQETIARLKSTYPKSQWVDDAEALSLEMRGPRGPGKLPEDEELKLYALQMLMMNDPERAEPLLKEYILEGKSNELRDRAMFILLQHPDAADSDLLNDALSEAANMQLKMSAIRLLGVLNDEKARALLDRTYRETDDETIRHMIIESYMTQGNADRLTEIARNEKDPDLKYQAVTMLGVMGEIGRIRDMYMTTSDPELRGVMLQGFALAGDGEMLFQILETEKDPEVRSTAIQNLIMVDMENFGPRLRKLYEKTSSAEERSTIIQIMAMQADAETLIALYHEEKNPEVRRHILQSMAIFMDDPAVADFFESFLKDD